MIIKIPFDPEKLKPSDECYVAFQTGGVLLRYWALYKHSFITSQHFKTTLSLMADGLKEAAERKELPWTDIDGFVQFVRSRQRDTFSFPQLPQFTGWVIQHWDHFSPNINRPVLIQFDRVEAVTKDLYA